MREKRTFPEIHMRSMIESVCISGRSFCLSKLEGKEGAAAAFNQDIRSVSILHSDGAKDAED